MRARAVGAIVLLWLAWGFWATALDHPWHLMFESGGQFFSGVARVHLDKGLAFTRGHDWIYNEDNPYSWGAGPERLEARAYGHHPPAVGLSLAAVFAAFGQSRAAARVATIVSHLATLLILLWVIPRWTPRRPAAALFAGLVVILVPMSGYFGRNVSHEAWVLPWIVLAVATYVRRIERRGDGTRLEDGLVCLFIAVAAFYDWPGFYLPPILVLFEAGRRRALGRLNRWLVATSAVLAVAIVGHLVWAAPEGLKLLFAGAADRVDPRAFGFTWVEWLGRVRDFTVQTYTRPVVVAAGLAVGAWIVRLIARREAGGPAAAFIAIGLAFGAVHIAAFPGGSWVHPYWMFYLMPSIALAAGLTAAELWHAPRAWLRWLLRIVVATWLVDILCAAHETLVWWFSVGSHPTGSWLLEWSRWSVPALVCDCARSYGLTWPIACSASLVVEFLPAALDHWLLALGFVIGGALLAVALSARLRSPRLQALLLVAGLAVILLPLTPSETTYDAALRQARAFLEGSVSLPQRMPWLEMFLYEGRYYFAYPPVVSAVVVPFLVLTGGYGGQPLFNTLLILASALLLHLLMRRLEGLRRYAVLGPIAYALGTPLVYSAATGNVWLLMHSEANVFLLLALWFGFVRHAYAWAGLFLSIGAQCRYAVALASVAFLVHFLREAPPGRRLRTVLTSGFRFAVPGTLAVIPTLAFSWLVFGDPLLSPYTLGWLEWGHGRLEQNFATKHLLPNLRFYFTARPELLPAFPYLHFGLAGQSIWVMSPFLLGIWIARRRYRFVRAFAAGAVAMAAFYFFYRAQGFAQYGARYMQDLYPLVVPLAAAGFARPSDSWSRAFAWLVALSVAINFYGLYVMSVFQR